jgi:hypothetical protein
LVHQKIIAGRYGLSQQHVSDIICGRSWKSVPVQPLDSKSTTL